MKRISCRLVHTHADREAVLRLREAVYVQSDQRISCVGDFRETFDKYDRYASYLLACLDGEPVGAVKVIRDSDIGLPCEEIASIRGVRDQAAGLVEFGHFITLPTVRKNSVVFAIMASAVSFAANECEASHILADVFFEKAIEDFENHFYRRLGCEIVHGPYGDHRFLEAPQSLVIVFSIAEMIRRAEQASGHEKRLLCEITSGIRPRQEQAALCG